MTPKTYTDGVLDERKRVRGLVEGMSVMGIGGQYGEGYESGFNKALTDLLALLDEGEGK